MLQLFILALVLLVFGIGFYEILFHKDAPKAASGRGAGGGPVTITTATAQKGDFRVIIKAIGTVTPVYTASIFSQVTGVVVGVNYQEGQIVGKGDKLTDIDDRQYEATLLQAQGTLEKDQAVLAQAQMDLKRYQDAWARNAVAKQILSMTKRKLGTAEIQGTVKNDQE